MGIAIFFFNHAFSYRYNLKKDLASLPNIGTLLFFPYARVIPMHLIIFIGLWAGRGSPVTLFFFLLLKSGVDILMHIIEHVNWKEEKEKDQSEKKRMSLKARLKLWFFLGWIAFLIVVVITFLIMKEL